MSQVLRGNKDGNNEGNMAKGDTKRNKEANKEENTERDTRREPRREVQKLHVCTVALEELLREDTLSAAFSVLHMSCMCAYLVIHGENVFKTRIS